MTVANWKGLEEGSFPSLAPQLLLIEPSLVYHPAAGSNAEPPLVVYMFIVYLMVNQEIGIRLVIGQHQQHTHHLPGEQRAAS